MTLLNGSQGLGVAKAQACSILFHGWEEYKFTALPSETFPISQNVPDTLAEFEYQILHVI